MKAIRGAVLLALAAVGTAANAGIFDTPGPFASYRLLDGPPAVDVTQYGTDWLTGSGPTQYFTDHGGNVLGAGTASVASRGAVGWAQAGATASGTGFSPIIWAGWTDQVSVNVAGLTGQHGTLTFSLVYDWQAPSTHASLPDNTMDGYAENYADVTFRALGAANSMRQYQYVSQFAELCGTCGAAQSSWSSGSMLGNASLSQDKAPVIANGLFTYTLDVVFGEQYFLTIGMNAIIAGHNGSVSIDPSNNISWAGLFSVRDSNGQLIDPNAVAMSSALGFDFSQAVTPVPEPQSAMLFLAGLGLLAGLRRRRH